MLTRRERETLDSPVADAVRRAVRRAMMCALLCFLVACGEHGIEEHFVDKGIEHNIPGNERGGPGAPAEAMGDASAEPSWTVPDGWERDVEDRPMRVATFLAPGPTGEIEVAVTRFSGRVGGELANVNRWRGQMGLPPIGEEELDPSLRRFDGPGVEGYQVRIETTDSVLLVVGVYEVGTDRTWFVRAAPASAGADRLESELLEFARSIAGVGSGGGSY